VILPVTLAPRMRRSWRRVATAVAFAERFIEFAMVDDPVSLLLINAR